MKRAKCFVSFFIILFLFLPYIAYSQMSGKIDGSIKDKKTGDPLPGVNVMIQGTSRGAASGADGYYFILNIQPGTYTVSAEMMGYKKYIKQNIRVVVGQTTKLNFELEETVLDIGEEVVVTADGHTVFPLFLTLFKLHTFHCLSLICIFPLIIQNFALHCLSKIIIIHFKET